MVHSIEIYGIIFEIVLWIAVSVSLVAGVFDLKVNLSTLNKVKKLEERVAELEQGSDSDA